VPRSSVQQGFATVQRAPGALAAEVAWRWCFGTAALGLVALVWIEFLKSIHVTDADLVLLRTRAPLLVADALAHMLAGSGTPLLRAVAVLTPGLAALWTLASAVGRAATLRALWPESRVRFSALLGIGLLRTALALAGVAAYMGAAFLASLVAPPDTPRHMVGFLVLFFLQMIFVAAIWSVLNWYLTLAPFTAAMSGGDTMQSLCDAAAASRTHRRELAQVSIFFGVLRFFAVLAVTVISLGGFARLAPRNGAAAVAFLVTISLAYFIAADYLHLARFAAFIAVLRGDDAIAVAADHEQMLLPTETGHAPSLP
jgi:hypothetical protein